MAEPEPSATDQQVGREDPTAWTGLKLDWIGGGGGRIEGVLVDAAAAGPRWLVVRTARFGRCTAVPSEFAVCASGRVWVPLRRELIRSAPEVDAGLGLDPAAERRLCEHYGMPARSRRTGELEAHPPDARSALPAARAA